MAGLRIPIQFFGEKPLTPVFEEFSPVFFICIIFKKELPGVTGGHRGSPGETGGDWGRPGETGGYQRFGERRNIFSILLISIKWQLSITRLQTQYKSKINKKHT